MKKIHIIFLHLLLISFFSCNKGTPNDLLLGAKISTQITLEGNWKLNNFEDGKSIAFPVNLVFKQEASEWKFNGISAVNQYAGSTAVNLNSRYLKVENMLQTEIGGPAEALTFEQKYFNRLRAVTSYEIVGAFLFLRANSTTFMVFQREL
jgi:META domain